MQNEPGACYESKTPRVYRPLTAYYLSTLTPLLLRPLKVNKHPVRLLCGFRKYACNPQEGQRKKATSEFKKTLTSKRGQVHNLPCENEFYLYENEKSFTYQRLST